MKIDNEYLKGLLEAFESSNEPFTDIESLQEQGFSYEEDVFVFHMDILSDKRFIENMLGSGIGYKLDSAWDRHWSIVPLRLTATGHDFISSINEPDVWESIQKNFKDSGIDTVKSVAIDLAKGFAKKKITALLESNEVASNS